MFYLSTLFSEDRKLKFINANTPAYYYNFTNMVLKGFKMGLNFNASIRK